MKKLILPALLALSISANAQLSTKEKDTYLSVSAGADIRNAAIGSDPTGNKPALNWITEFHAVSQNVDITIGYEEFAQIKYSRMIAGLGYHFPLYAYIGNTEIKTTFQPSLEASIIKRTYTDHYTYQGRQFTEERTPGFLAYGINLAFQWQLNDSFAVQTATNIIQRPDKYYLYNEENRWVLSNYLKFVYIIN